MRYLLQIRKMRA